MAVTKVKGLSCYLFRRIVTAQSWVLTIGVQLTGHVSQFLISDKQALQNSIAKIGAKRTV